MANFVGVIACDAGLPNLPYGPTVDEWRVAHDTRFTEVVGPIYEHWGKPVLFYRFHPPRHADDPDLTGQDSQARRREGAFHAMEQRP